jgi:hypothetical protein
MSLVQYVNEKNVWRVLSSRNKTPYDIKNLSAADKKELRAAIEGDLSPENLCCDGEAPAAYVRKRAKILNKALADLNKIC